MLYRYLCIRAKVNTQSSQMQSLVYRRRNNIFTALCLKKKPKSNLPPVKLHFGWSTASY